MTDQRARAVERAEQVIRDVHKDLPDIWLGGRQRYVLVEAIASALADAERGGMVRAAKILDEYAAVCSEETLAVRKRTLMVMADQLRADAADDKAQAGEEG